MVNVIMNINTTKGSW